MQTKRDGFPKLTYSTNTVGVYRNLDPVHQHRLRKSSSKPILARTLPISRHAGLVRSYNTHSLPYLNVYNGAPNVNVDPITRIKQRTTHPNRAYAISEEERERIQSKMDRIKADKKRMQMRKRRLLERKVADLETAVPSALQLTEDEARQAREEVYGTAVSKALIRERARRREERKARIRKLPITEILKPESLRRRKAVQFFEEEARIFKQELPPPRVKAKRDSVVSLESTVPRKEGGTEEYLPGLGVHGIMEGDVTIMLRCKNVLIPTSSPVSTVNIVGHEDEKMGKGWRCFGETERTDDTVNPIFSVHFLFAFLYPVKTELKLALYEKKHRFMGGVQVQLHELLAAACDAKDRYEHVVQEKADREAALKRDQAAGVMPTPIVTTPPPEQKSQYTSEWLAEEEIALVDVPMTALGTDPDLERQLNEAGSVMVFLVDIKAIRFRPAILGKKQLHEQKMKHQRMMKRAMTVANAFESE